MAAIWASRHTDLMALSDIYKPSGFPQVQPRPMGRLTSVFEMGTGEPRPYGRPLLLI